MLSLRQRAKLSQRQAALKSGMTPGALSHIESGDNAPSVATLEAYAEVCGGALTLVHGDGSALIKAVEALRPDLREVLLRLVRAAPLLDPASMSSLIAFADFADRVAARQNDQRDRASEA